MFLTPGLLNDDHFGALDYSKTLEKRPKEIPVMYTGATDTGGLMRMNWEPSNRSKAKCVKVLFDDCGNSLYHQADMFNDVAYDTFNDAVNDAVYDTFSDAANNAVNDMAFNWDHPVSGFTPCKNVKPPKIPNSYPELSPFQYVQNAVQSSQPNKGVQQYLNFMM